MEPTKKEAELIKELKRLDALMMIVRHSLMFKAIPKTKLESGGIQEP